MKRFKLLVKKNYSLRGFNVIKGVVDEPLEVPSFSIAAIEKDIEVEATEYTYNSYTVFELRVNGAFVQLDADTYEIRHIKTLEVVDVQREEVK